MRKISMTRQDFDKTIRIPVVTDVVRAGDAEVIAQARNMALQEQRRANFEARLKDRIAELQAATGQDAYNGLARSHAIRSENRKQAAPHYHNAPFDPALERHLDQARDEFVRQLTGMLHPNPTKVT